MVQCHINKFYNERDIGEALHDPSNNFANTTNIFDYMVGFQNLGY